MVLGATFAAAATKVFRDAVVRDRFANHRRAGRHPKTLNGIKSTSASRTLLGWLRNEDVAVGIFPQPEEIRIRNLAGVRRAQWVRSAQCCQVTFSVSSRKRSSGEPSFR